MISQYRIAILAVLLRMVLTTFTVAQESKTESPRFISGVYPHLTMWNNHGECGTGAIVPWAGKLWAITYAPHQPKGSTDKLYAIDSKLEQQIFAGSVGGTPANRMIHRESRQLIIGPYFVSDQGKIRTIPPSQMPGRLTGVARHLSDPENKVYFATMEEGIYEVDVHTLKVQRLFADHQGQINQSDEKLDVPLAALPGYHGKGLYSGQNRLIYANNGEPSATAKERPDIPSGCLAEWDGRSETWRVVRRNQFTDVRGPGGLYGNSDPESDPIWAIGWDHRSVILMLLDKNQWYTYRLPKASNCYDGAHGWNTEWPRFRQLRNDQFLLNMHGMFWDFPSTFSRENSHGIRPKSTYLKVIGDYCLWNDRIVMGCDDTAANEFLNTRKAKGTIAGPGQSHSNLWFLEPSELDNLGTPSGNGAIWINEPVRSGQPSDPFLFGGFKHRQLCLNNPGDQRLHIKVEIDIDGNHSWSTDQIVEVPAKGTVWKYFPIEHPGEWLRLNPLGDSAAVTAHLSYRNESRQSTKADPIFDGIASQHDSNYAGGLVRVRGAKMKKLAVVAQSAGSESETATPARFYELDEQLKLRHVDDESAMRWNRDRLQVPKGIIEFDEASAIYIDQDQERWRFPLSVEQPSELVGHRIAREVVTERDLFNCGGTFYELPARNAGGIRKIRPICTHKRLINDYCSYRGLMVITGINLTEKNDEHIIRSEDNQAAVWVGAIDDLWKFGKPRGVGGPWNETSVLKDKPSDPYLINGFDSKILRLAAKHESPLNITIEVDITGDGNWVSHSVHSIGNKGIEYSFPTGFSAYWIRFTCDRDAIVTAQLNYR